MIESPDDTSEIACPMVLHGVVGVLQSLLSFPPTALTYQVLLASEVGARARSKARSGRPTNSLHFMMFPPFRLFCCLHSKIAISRYDPHAGPLYHGPSNRASRPSLTVG